jgi:hypothetical protein
MAKLDEIAQQLELTGRTLRRAILRGTIRGTRVSPRRFDLEPQEREYIRRYWPLIGRILQVLRTQPNVRLAVLFGSVSRGEERRDSDVDRDGDWRRLKRRERQLQLAAAAENERVADEIIAAFEELFV